MPLYMNVLLFLVNCEALWATTLLLSVLYKEIKVEEVEVMVTLKIVTK